MPRKQTRSVMCPMVNVKELLPTPKTTWPPHHGPHMILILKYVTNIVNNHGRLILLKIKIHSEVYLLCNIFFFFFFF